jgi:hypothetical protein
MSVFKQMILVYRTGALSTPILIRTNNENPCRLHIFSVTTAAADNLILRRPLSATSIRLIISKLIALNLLLLLISRVDPDLRQYSLSGLSTNWTLASCKVCCRINKGISAEDTL